MVFCVRLRSLSLRDLIVYQALVNYLAEAFATTQDRYALKQSFGALFAGKSSPFFYRSWKTCYASYNEAITRHIRQETVLWRISTLSRFMN